jgi:lipopolysaccharide transport system permease protein
VVTLRTIRRERLLRAMGRAFTLPISTIARNRSLIRTMVRRDILGRYRGSFGGIFWTILNPLLLMLTYFFVFGVVLQARSVPIPAAPASPCISWPACCPGWPFSEAAGRAPTVMLEHRNFVKKLVFAVETLPNQPGGVGFGNRDLRAAALHARCFPGARLGARFGGLAARVDRSAGALHRRRLLVPGGAGRIRARPGTGDRLPADALVFPDPHLLSGSVAARGTLPLLSKNPMFVLVRGYRAIFLEGHAPALGSLWKLWIAAAVVFILGHAWFYKLRRSFADII